MNASTSRAWRACRPFGWLFLFPLLAGCESTGAGGLSAFGGAPAEDEDTWAIRCLTIQGPNRIQLADDYAKSLKQVKALKSDLVRVIHEDEETSVFYGRYQRRYDPKTGQETYLPNPLRDLEFIRTLSLDIQDPLAGRRTVWPFQLATMSTLPGGRGSKPEWLLTRAPGYFSLQVGVFYNSGEMRQRKFAAEEYCKMLRQQGESAYYFHGPVNSIVCLGAFPQEAIQTMQKADPLTGIIYVKAVIVDPRVLELQKRFPHNTHNGNAFYEITKDPKTGEDIREPHTSFLVEVPRTEGEANPLTGEP